MCKPYFRPSNKEITLKALLISIFSFSFFFFFFFTAPARAEDEDHFRLSLFGKPVVLTTIRNSSNRVYQSRGYNGNAMVRARGRQDEVRVYAPGIRGGAERHNVMINYQVDHFYPSVHHHVVRETNIGGSVGLAVSRRSGLGNPRYKPKVFKWSWNFHDPAVQNRRY